MCSGVHMGCMEVCKDVYVQVHIGVLGGGGKGVYVEVHIGACIEVHVGMYF